MRESITFLEWIINRAEQFGKSIQEQLEEELFYLNMADNLNQEEREKIKLLEIIIKFRKD